MPKKISESKKQVKTKAVAKKLSQEEFEKKVLELAKKGLTSEKIGESLRKEGIHPQEYKKKISTILKENNVYISPDLKNVKAKLEKIQKHFEKNKQDKRSMRDKERIFSKVRNFERYYKAT